MQSPGLSQVGVACPLQGFRLENWTDQIRRSSIFFHALLICCRFYFRNLKATRLEFAIVIGCDLDEMMGYGGAGLHV